MATKIKLSIIFILFIFFNLGLSAQNWKSSLMKNPNPTFFEIQEAFYTYFDANPEKTKEKGSGYKQFKRWEWFWETRVNSNGTFPKNTVVIEEWEKWTTKESDNNVKVSSDWTFLGPSTAAGGYEGIGRVNCIAFHPTDFNTFWIGTPAGGLWKTTDFGATWTTNTDNLPVLGVSDIAIDYTNPDIMYIATGDGDGGSLYAGLGDTKSIGILKSTNGGATWTNVLSATPDQGVLIRRLLIHPTNPQILIAVTSVGIFKTTDGGTNWSATQIGYFIDLEFKPGEPSTVYATTFDNTGAGNAQIYRSTNTGDTWTQVTSLSGINRINIAVSAAAPTLVDAVCSRSDNGGLAGLWYSSNSGASFSQYWLPAWGNFLGWYGDAVSDENGQGSYDLAYAIDPTNANNIFLGGINTWKTNDGGASWSPSNCWTESSTYNTTGADVVHADKHFLTFHPLNSSYLFECNDGGVYYSNDGGTTWNDISNGLQITQFYKFSNSTLVPSTIVGGCQDNSTKYKDGSNWGMIYPTGDGMECIVDYTDENIYVSGPKGLITRLNSGSGVHDFSANISGNPEGRWVTPYVIHPTDNLTFYAGYDKVYQTSNQGATWSAISPILDGGLPINYLVVSSSNPDYIYAATLSDIYKTTDGGTSWYDITPVHTANISSLTVDPTNANGILVTLSGYIDGEKVFLTNDGGSTWYDGSGSLPNLPVNCSVINKNHGTIYLGTDVGVYVWDDNSSDWILFNDNLPNVVITELEIQYSALKIRAATFGRGIWESNLYSSINILASVSPINSGTIAGDGIYDYGTTANLIATAETGYNFVNWTENGTQVSTNTNYSFTATEDRTLVASFEIQTFNISASANPSNGGNVTGAGTYDYGQTASLTATAETGYVFANWTENGTQVSTNTNYSFTVTENRTLIANFEIQTFNISASSNPSNGGTITGTGTYDYGATASLTATAETNYDFVNWTENGTQVSANANYSFTVTDNRTLVANFDETISVNQLERNSFQIYPNPTSANLYVKSNLFTEYNSKAYKLYLIDYLGREFKINYNREVSDVIQIDMNSFGSGVYYLKIMNNNKLIGSFEIIKID